MGCWSRSCIRSWWRPWRVCRWQWWRLEGGIRPASARQETCTCGAGMSRGSWLCPPRHWQRSGHRLRTQEQGTPRSSPRSSQWPRTWRSFPSRRSRPCWICHRTWRSLGSAAAPGTRLWSHAVVSSTPGDGVNMGSWDTGTRPALTNHAVWSSWWPRGCEQRRWCVGPGPPTSVCRSWEDPTAPPPQGHRGALLCPGQALRGCSCTSAKDKTVRTEQLYYIYFSLRAVGLLCAAQRLVPASPRPSGPNPGSEPGEDTRGAIGHPTDTQRAAAMYTYRYYSHQQYIQSYRARGQNLENK